MRNTVAAFAVLTLVACGVKETPSPELLTVEGPERLTLEKVERKYEIAGGKSTVRPAPGNIFVIVSLIEKRERWEDREWLDSLIEDWDGRTYHPRNAHINKGESGTSDSFGRPIKTIHPNRTDIIFEVPEASTLRRLTVPHPIALFEPPAEISKPEAAPKVVHRVEPLYPEAARQRGIHGLVKLKVLVMPNGRVAGAESVHGPSVLGEAAEIAVRQWRYEPHIVDGKAVPVLIQVHIEFAPR